MSWSKESTIGRMAVVVCSICIAITGCSESDNSWNLFAKDNPRKVEPATNTPQSTTPPKAEPAKSTDAVATKSDAETDDGSTQRGDPNRIEQYATNLNPSSRQPTTGNSPMGANGGTNNPMGGTNSTAMSPVRMTSDREPPALGSSTPITNNTAAPPRRNNTLPSGSNSAADTSTTTNTLVTPTRPTSSLDDANEADTRPKFIDNEQLANQRSDTNNIPTTTTPPSTSANTNNTGAPKLSNVTVENVRPAANPTTTNNPSIAANTTDASPIKNDPNMASRQLEIAEQESKVAANPTDVQALFKLRTMYLLDGRESDAYAPMEGIPTDTQEIVMAQLRSLASVREASPNDPATWANRQLDAMRDLQEKLRAQADLQVPKVVLCTDIVAFGKYTPFESNEFEAGYDHAVVLYVEVDNFKSEVTAGGLHRTKFAARVSMLSKDGEQLSTFVEEPVIEDMNRGPRRDFFMSFGPFTIPGVFPAGEYTIKVQVDDLLAGKTNSNKTTLKLVP